MAKYTTAKSRYNTLEAIRDPFLDRARDSAEFTIPSIMPREYHSKHTTLHTPYQGIGARGTNNLSSKLLLALLPPNQPFFRLTLDEFTLSELSGRDDMKGEFDSDSEKELLLSKGFKPLYSTTVVPAIFATE